MINPLMTALLTLLVTANLFLIGILAYAGKGESKGAGQVGITFAVTVLTLDTLFSIGGVVLW